MSEFRQNIANGEWVIIAKDRGRRPEDFKRGGDCPRNDLKAHYEECPFCDGTEEEGELKVIYDNEKEERVRIVANKYSALSIKESPLRKREGMFIKAGGYGVSDVLIESPVHNVDLSLLSLENVSEVIRACKLRYNQILGNKSINMINVFRNHGRRAGASLFHPHSQIIGSLVAPPHVSDQIEYARRSYNTFGSCVYCAMIAEELEKSIRVVAENEHFVAICPYASKSPYEIRILPKRHSSVFGNIEGGEIEDYSKILKLILKKIYKLLGDPDYNFIIRSITTYDGEVPFYHWYMVIIPRLTRSAGFEIGTGIYINIMEPEFCAKSLRETDIN